MGTQSGGNGGGWPPDGLPDLPPEWGTIVIPDDASELAQEAGRVRRELRREARQRRWRRRLHLRPARPKPTDEDEPTLGIPLMVISIAVIATLTSLFAIAWPTRPQRPDLQPTTAVATTPATMGNEATTPSAVTPGDNTGRLPGPPGLAGTAQATTTQGAPAPGSRPETGAPAPGG